MMEMMKADDIIFKNNYDRVSSYYFSLCVKVVDEKFKLKLFFYSKKKPVMCCNIYVYIKQT